MLNSSQGSMCRIVQILLFQDTNLDHALVRDCLFANVIETLAQHEPGHRG